MHEPERCRQVRQAKVHTDIRFVLGSTPCELLRVVTNGALPPSKTKAMLSTWHPKQGR